MKISACMIVKNESENIQRCINSYNEIVDEIIVVDTGSTDNTVELAQKLGARVLFMQWQNDFATPKNYAIENATGDWIIFLDADEYFGEGSSQKLLNAFKFLNNQNIYNSMSCKMYHLDSEDGKIKGYNAIVRVFKRNDSIRYKNSIHEDLIDNGKALNSVYFNDIVTYHTGYAASRIAGKHSRNIEILESNVSKGEADTMTYYYLCNSYDGLKDYEKSFFYADKTFEEEKKSGLMVPRAFRYKVYLLKIQSMGLLDNRYSDKEIGKVVDKAILEYPDHPEILWIKAQYLVRIKRYRDALDCFFKAIESNKSNKNDMCNYFEGYIHQAYCDIGAIYVYMNKEEAAIEYFIMALEKNKYNKDAAVRMLRLIRNNKDEFIISLMNEIYNTNEFVDMQFVIACLCEVKIKIPLIYYTKKWNSTFKQEDISVLLSMLALEKYNDVIKLGLITAKNNETKVGLDIALTAILLTGSKNFYKDELIAIDPNSYQLLDYFEDGSRNFLLDDSFIDLLKSVLNLIIPFCSNRIPIEFLEFILNHCTDEASYILFDQLLFYDKYETALEYYSKLFEKANDKGIKGRICFISGFCAYKLKKFDKSVEMLNKAIDYGNGEYEATELLGIIDETGDDNYGDTGRNKRPYQYEQAGQGA